MRVLVHVNVSLNLQRICTFVRDQYQRKTLFVVDVSTDWATNGHWRTKVSDTWQVAQVTVPRQESVKTEREMCIVSIRVILHSRLFPRNGE